MELMQNSKIQGNYLIEIDLTNFSKNFTFQGNNRNTLLHPVHGAYIARSVVMNNSAITGNVYFIRDNVLKIKRAKIVTIGADGLRGGFDILGANNIAQIILNAVEINDLSATYGEFSLSFNRYNEWEDFNAEFMPNKNAPQKYALSVDGISDISVDDYNIQSAYLGQGFKSKLILDIDTAGLHPASSLNPYDVI